MAHDSLVASIPTIDIDGLYMTASRHDRCLKINILKWKMPYMHRNVWSLAIGEQICPKTVLSYHADKSDVQLKMKMLVSQHLRW
jgi:hypothetical protein